MRSVLPRPVIAILARGRIFNSTPFPERDRRRADFFAVDLPASLRRAESFFLLTDREPVLLYPIPFGIYAVYTNKQKRTNMPCLCVTLSYGFRKCLYVTCY